MLREGQMQRRIRDWRIAAATRHANFLMPIVTVVE
jgi:hypothetical protein